MSEADKMFKELGYEKYDNHPEDDFPPEPNRWVTQDCRVIEYSQSATIKKEIYTLCIRFHVLDKRVEIGANKRPEEYRITALKLNPVFNAKELQAINQKCKELGWIE